MLHDTTVVHCPPFPQHAVPGAKVLYLGGRASDPPFNANNKPSSSLSRPHLPHHPVLEQKPAPPSLSTHKPWSIKYRQALMAFTMMRYLLKPFRIISEPRSSIRRRSQRFLHAVGGQHLEETEAAALRLWPRPRVAYRRSFSATRIANAAVGTHDRHRYRDMPIRVRNKEERAKVTGELLERFQQGNVVEGIEYFRLVREKHYLSISTLVSAIRAMAVTGQYLEATRVLRKGVLTHHYRKFQAGTGLLLSRASDCEILRSWNLPLPQGERIASMVSTAQF